MWNRYEFKPGDRVARADGAWAEVLSAEAGGRLRVRYTVEGADPPAAGTQDTLAVDHVASVSPAPPGPEWGDEVTVMVHRVPETEDSEGSFEAVTMGGVPHGLIVTGSSVEDAGGALDNLLNGLRAFGFSGVAFVENHTNVGSVQRYEVRV